MSGLCSKRLALSPSGTVIESGNLSPKSSLSSKSSFGEVPKSTCKALSCLTNWVWIEESEVLALATEDSPKSAS